MKNTASNSSAVANVVERFLPASDGEELSGEDDNDDSGIAQHRYLWESGVDRSWSKAVTSSSQQHKGVSQFGSDFKSASRLLTRKRPRDATSRGVLRNLVVVVDESDAMRDIDIKPDRFTCTIKALETFIQNFFLANPISQLALVSSREAMGCTLTHLSANPEYQTGVLRERLRIGCQGAMSVQASLERAIGLLGAIPRYGTREALFIVGSIRSIDSGSVLETIADAKNHNIRASVIGLSPEVYVLKKLCSATGGVYSVAMNVEHFHDLLNGFTKPPDCDSATVAVSLVTMGFPKLTRKNTLALCMCHGSAILSSYTCPRCESRTCEVPSKCRACGLHLVSSANIFRTNHLLQDYPEFDCLSDETAVGQSCAACMSVGVAYRCLKCRNYICSDCLEFVENFLQKCVVCLKDEV